MSDDKKKPGIENLKPFSKGVSGNPNGRPALPSDVLKARNMNAIEFTRIINDFMRMSLEDVEKITQDKSETMLRKLLAHGFIHACAGNKTWADLILDRSVGPVKNELNLNVLPKPTVIERRGGGEIEMGAQLVEGDDED